MANMAKTMLNLKRLGRTEDLRATERTKTRDIESGQISPAVYWTCYEVADYIVVLGFPQYRVKRVCLVALSFNVDVRLGMFSSKRNRWKKINLV